jgi:hypothetical protein
MGSGYDVGGVHELASIETSWKQLKDKTIFLWERLRCDERNRVDLLGLDPSREGQNSDRQMTGFLRNDHVRRSEFSLHIGC